MISDIQKSLSAIFYERTSSPLYGTLLVSWMIWNWKIIYLTLFISEEKIDKDKISYISENFYDLNNLIIYPILSAFVLLTLIPFVSNGSYWLSLNFEKWKKDKKHQVEKKQLLTLEQSIEIREQILNHEIRFEKLLENKNKEIEQLRALIEESKSNSEKIEEGDFKNQIDEIDLDIVLQKIKAIDSDLTNFQKILEFMQSGYQISGRSDIPPRLITILEVNDIIESKGNGLFKITENGKKLAKRLFD